MTIINIDEVLTIEDEIVEVVAGDVPVRLGIGAIGYIHPGVIVTGLRDRAIAYLAPGARIEEIDAAALESAEVTVAQWTNYPQLPLDVDVTLMIPIQEWQPTRQGVNSDESSTS